MKYIIQIFEIVLLSFCLIVSFFLILIVKKTIIAIFSIWFTEKILSVPFASNQFQELQTILTELGLLFILRENCVFLKKKTPQKKKKKGCDNVTKCAAGNITADFDCQLKEGPVQCDNQGFITRL